MHFICIININVKATFGSYTMRGDVSCAMVQIANSIKGTLASLSMYIEDQLNDITTNPVYAAAATIGHEDLLFKMGS